MYRAFKQLPAREIALLGLLLGIRQVPKRLTGRARSAERGRAERPVIGDFLAYGFTLLADEPSTSTVVGAIGRWWSPSGNEPVAGISDSDAFRAFDAPGYAKAAVAFEFSSVGPGTAIRTETRIACTDASARRLFGAYWLLIRLPSGLIRRSWLAAIERRAVGARD